MRSFARDSYIPLLYRAPRTLATEVRRHGSHHTHGDDHEFFLHGSSLDNSGLTLALEHCMYTFVVVYKIQLDRSLFYSCV